MVAADTALATIEKRTLTGLAAQVRTVSARLSTYLAALIDTDPTLTGTELLSRADVHRMLTGQLGQVHEQAVAAVGTGYRAAAALGRAATAAALSRELPGAGELGDYLPAVLADITRAVGAAALDIADGVRAGYDGVTGSKAAPARALAAGTAVRNAGRRLAARLAAAATAAVHRGYTDAQVAAARALQQAHPGTLVVKRWRTTSATPCPSCAALAGSTIPLVEQYDHTATTDPAGRRPQVYRDLAGPPRHPYCRCRLDLSLIVVTPPPSSP